MVPSDDNNASTTPEEGTDSERDSDDNNNQHLEPTDLPELPVNRLEPIVVIPHEQEGFYPRTSEEQQLAYIRQSGATNVDVRLMTPQEAIDDLAKSGLEWKDIYARRLEDIERQACGASIRAKGYVLPYHTFEGVPTQFYRIKITNPREDNNVKYRQPKKTENFIYFPKGFKECFERWVARYPKKVVIIVTEGEKKAACAVKNGFPCIGLSGVFSWRTKSVTLPKGVELTSKKNSIIARLPSSQMELPEAAQMATGWNDVLRIIKNYKGYLVIAFDSDKYGATTEIVQAAAAQLAYELRFADIPARHIRQVMMPNLSPPNTDPDYIKAGLDDFLVIKGKSAFHDILFTAMDNLDAFPCHPDPRRYLSKKMEGMYSRTQAMQVASIVLAELDAKGSRFTGPDDTPFYYERSTHKLIGAPLLGKGKSMHESPFGKLLYRKFEMTGMDIKILQGLASQYTGEDPISSVTPRRIKTLITEADDPRNPHGLALQCSDSNFFVVSPDPRSPVRLHRNGDLGLLFEQGQVEPLDVDRVLEEFDNLNSEIGLDSWWLKVIKETNVGKSMTTTTLGISEQGKNMQKLASLLYYVSPYLNRWRGVQLPVEIMIGEPGSGKSSLAVMRQNILTGFAHLRNVPNDVRDWHASIANSGGLHVTDNVHFTTKQLKQLISDDICRLITEPVPSIEMRKLYTNAEQVRVPIDVTFLFTAVMQPFQNADIFSRAAIFETSAVGKNPDGDWVRDQIDRFGGREMWMAHQLVFLHRMFRMADKEGPDQWDPKFPTSHRLAHFEQCLTMAAKVLGMSPNFISRTISGLQASALNETDWTMEALTAYIDSLHADRFNSDSTEFTATDISQWCTEQEDFQGNPLATNPRKLGRYIQSNYSQIVSSTGMKFSGTVGNLKHYRRGTKPDPKPDPDFGDELDKQE